MSAPDEFAKLLDAYEQAQMRKRAAEESCGPRTIKTARAAAAEAHTAILAEREKVERYARHWHGEIESIGAMLDIGAPDAGEAPAAVQKLIAQVTALEKQLAEARVATIEECAKLLEQYDAPFVNRIVITAALRTLAQPLQPQDEVKR